MSTKIVNFLPWSLLGLFFVSQAVDLMHIENAPPPPPPTPPRATTLNQLSAIKMVSKHSDVRNLEREMTTAKRNTKEILNQLLTLFQKLKRDHPSISLFPSWIESFIPNGCTEWNDEKYEHLMLINVGRIIKTLPEVNISILMSALTTIDVALKRINNDAETEKILIDFVEVWFAFNPLDGRNLQFIYYLIKVCKQRHAIFEVAALITKKKPSLAGTSLCGSEYDCNNGIPIIVKTLVQFISETQPSPLSKMNLLNALHNKRKLKQFEELHKDGHRSAAALKDESLEVKILVLFEFLKINSRKFFPSNIRSIIVREFAPGASHCKLIAVGAIGQLMDDDSIMTFVEFILLMKRLVNIFPHDPEIQEKIETKLIDIFLLYNSAFFKFLLKSITDSSVYSVFIISLLKLEPTEHRLFEIVRAPILPPGRETSFNEGRSPIKRQITKLSTFIASLTGKTSLWARRKSKITDLPLTTEPEAIGQSLETDTSPSLTERIFNTRKKLSKDSYDSTTTTSSLPIFPPDLETSSNKRHFSNKPELTKLSTTGDTRRQSDGVISMWGWRQTTDPKPIEQSLATHTSPSPTARALNTQEVLPKDSYDSTKSLMPIVPPGLGPSSNQKSPVIIHRKITGDKQSSYDSERSLPPFHHEDDLSTTITGLPPLRESNGPGPKELSGIFFDKAPLPIIKSPLAETKGGRESLLINKPPVELLLFNPSPRQTTVTLPSLTKEKHYRRDLDDSTTESTKISVLPTEASHPPTAEAKQQRYKFSLNFRSNRRNSKHLRH